MAAPVWVLSVDLKTNTATFQSGMADAAKAARSSFSDIKDGAGQMGREVGGNMSEARHGVMLLGEEFGVHLPRALTSFIASIGPIGAAMEAAFPFLAIIVGATLLFEHLSKLREEGEKLTQSQERFGIAAQNALNSLDDKILQAGIRADELNNDHLGALHKQLLLIDRTSMNELVHSFEQVEKAADEVFGELKVSWYQFGIGSAGAKHALDDFKNQYDSLLAQGKDKDASDLLAGTKRTAERVLELQHEIVNHAKTGPGQGQTKVGDYAKYLSAVNELKQYGVGVTEKEIQSQQQLVDTLNAQVNVQERVNALKKLEEQNATHETGNKIQGDADAVARANAEAEKREQEYAQKQWEQAHAEAVANLEANEKQKIDATEKGSALRLQAIEAAIKKEEAYGLQETGFYRGLLDQRIELIRQMSDEEAKQKEAAGKEAAEHGQKMAELELQMTKDKTALANSSRRVSDAERVNQEIAAADAEYRVKEDALDREIAALDKNGKDYENKLKALQDRELELRRQHENQVTEIRDKAEEQRNARIMAAETRFEDSLASGLTSVLMRHESFAKMLVSLGDQIVSGMIQNALKSIMANDMTKESDAAAAARKAYLAGMHFPFPVNLVMGPALGAMAFASVMAFEAGGVVPGVENYDSVNAKLMPGETVIPKRMSERLEKAADGSGENHYHVHPVFAPEIHAIDATGVDKMLTKHANVFHRHVENTLRRMNK